MHKFFRLTSIFGIVACCLFAGCMKYGAPIMNDQKDVFMLPYTKTFIGMPTKSGLLICVPRVDGVKCVEGPEMVSTLPCNARDQAILNFCNTSRCNQSAVSESVPAVAEKQEPNLKTRTNPTRTEVAVPGPIKTENQIPPPAQTGIQISSPAKEADVMPSADCIRVCDRFVLTMPYSNVRKVTRESCLRRCGAGDMDFSVCAWQVQKPEDVQTCMKMPGVN